MSTTVGTTELGSGLESPAVSSRGPMAAKWLALGVLVASALAIFTVMQPNQIFTANTPTGGDMGAHVYLPAYLRDTLLPSGRLMGWSNDWYAGFPALYFYFPLPALATVLLDVLLPYGVAFKLVTVAGLVALPFATYFFVRAMAFPRAVATIAAAAGSTYVFTESHTIFGGNIPATLAGEFSFSWSFALSFVYLGMVIKASREGRRFSPLAGVVLALAALSHLITTLVVVLASLPLLLRKRGAGPVLGAWGLGFALAAIWGVPLLARVGGFTTDMNWQPVQGFDKVLPREMIVIAILAGIGLVWSAVKGYDVMPALWMAALSVSGYYLIAWSEFTKLYNARLLPYWYMTLFIFAGVAVGLMLVWVSRRVSRRRSLLLVGTGVASGFFLVAGVTGLSFAPAWAEWNYEGYEGKAVWPELEALMKTVDDLPPGRVMWEANNELNRYGTPMSLMLLPYWTEGTHPSMEGLLFESALTTPFHFLNAAEVSRSPSNPIRGLRYHTFEFDRALAHLPLYNVSYYVSFTEEATTLAEERLLKIVESPPFSVFALPESSLVDVATTQPVVYNGDDFLEAALAWYDDVDSLDRWVVADGPDSWVRVGEPEGLFDRAPITVEPGGAVTNVELEDHRIAFETSAVGVPHLVKVSYFPNWEAKGAEGPYRAAPSLMVVIPTDEQVELRFGYTWAEQLGLVFTVGGILFLVGYGMRRRIGLRGKGR